MSNPLFRQDYLLTKPARYRADKDFVSQGIAEEIEEKLKDHQRSFKNIAIIAPKHVNVNLDGAHYEPDDNLKLPIGNFDLVLHIGALHAHNDVVGQMIQCRNALQPDGVFLAGFLGGQSLTELGKSMLEIEIATYNGATQRVAPMIDIRDGGRLLHRAGFALPVADNWHLNAEYAGLTELLRDLRQLGLSRPLLSNSGFLGKTFYRRLKTHYHHNYTCESGNIKASFEFIFLTGYAPSDNQPKPLRPGSVTTSFFEAIEKTK